MSQDIRAFVAPSCELLAFGEPTHQEPAFGHVRNELFASLVDCGFSSIALETDRASALEVNDYVHDGTGSLEKAMGDGFSHSFGDLGDVPANRELVTWMRDYNEGHPVEERLAFHGFDAPTEPMSAPSPRRYLEHACDYLGLDLDLRSLLGTDERWSRQEAILDPAMSVGASTEAAELRAIADDMLTELYARAPELIAATSRDDWFRTRAHLDAALGLLRYHTQAAQRIDESVRISRLLATRAALMAQNLLAIRGIEARSGATLVFAHNAHLQRNLSRMRIAGMDLDWFSAGAIVDALLGRRYAVVVGSLGRSDALGLGEPEPDSYEGLLQRRTTTWGLSSAATIASARTRTDTGPGQAYSPLDKALVDSADGVLHIAAGR